MGTAIDETIDNLVRQLAGASRDEAIQIRTRLMELEDLKKKGAHVAT